MSRTLPKPTRRRNNLVGVAALASVALAGCVSQEGSTAAPETKVVSAAGISFEVPEGWEELDAKDVSEGAGANPVLGDLADQMGITPDQFEKLMGSADLMLFSDEGAQQGFLDNVVVLQPGGRMPNDEQLKLQALQLGGDAHDISHEQTELGEVTSLAYELPIADNRVQGEAIFIEGDDGLVSVTVSATDRDTTEEISEGILDTLAEGP